MTEDVAEEAKEMELELQIEATIQDHFARLNQSSKGDSDDKHNSAE